MNANKTTTRTPLLMAALLMAAPLMAQDDQAPQREPLRADMTITLPADLWGPDPSEASLNIRLDADAANLRDKGAIHVVAFGRSLEDAILVPLAVDDRNQAHLSVPAKMARALGELAEAGYALQVFRIYKEMVVEASQVTPLDDVETKQLDDNQPQRDADQDWAQERASADDDSQRAEQQEMHSARDEDQSLQAELGSRRDI